MKYSAPLIPGTLINRYKRFLADVRLADGSELTVHCPNPGAMAGLNAAGNKVWISDSLNPKRKLRFTLEQMQVGETMVGINTNRANTLALEAMKAGLIACISSDAQIRPEQKYGENSRIDFMISQAFRPTLYVEVKNVHFMRQTGLHEFPDGVTARGAKHLVELMNEVNRGNQALMLFVVQRDDGDQFKIAEDIDSQYGRLFRQALSAGVQAKAICCSVLPEEIVPYRQIEVIG